MNAYEDMENRVKAHGVRVAERLAILAKLRQFDGQEQLGEALEKHERAIEEAAKKVRRVLR